jgi:hypothetical protein
MVADAILRTWSATSRHDGVRKIALALLLAATIEQAILAHPTNPTAPDCDSPRVHNHGLINDPFSHY